MYLSWGAAYITNTAHGVVFMSFHEHLCNHGNWFATVYVCMSTSNSAGLHSVFICECWSCQWLCLDYFVCVRLFSCIISACMLYYCNTVRWAWLDWGLSGWLTILLQCFDTVGWVIRPVKTVGRITYIVLVQTLNHAQSVNQSLTVCIWIVMFYITLLFKLYSVHSDFLYCIVSCLSYIVNYLYM